MPRKRSRSRSRSGGSISRRTLLLLLGVGGAGAASAVETGAFDAVSGQRPFDIASASDGNAFLKIDIGSPGGDNGERVTLLTLTNRFDSPFDDIDASVSSPSSAPIDASRVTAPNGLDVGESGTVTAPLSCGSDADTDVEVSITASGDDESVELTRSVPVDCRVPSRGVCDPRSIPSDEQTVETVKSTADGISVDVDVAGPYDEEITGDVTVRGALAITSDDNIRVEFSGSASVRDHFRLVSTGAGTVELMGGTPEITNGPLQIDTGGDARVDINGAGNASIGGGHCVTAGGAATVILQNQTVEGDLEVAGGSLNVTVKNTTVEGDLVVKVRDDDEDEDEDGGNGRGKRGDDEDGGNGRGKRGDDEDGGNGRGKRGDDEDGGNGRGKRGDDEDEDDDEDDEDGNSVDIAGNSTITGDFTITGDEDVSVSGCSKVQGDTPEACEDD